MKLISRFRSVFLWSMFVVLPAAVMWAGPVVKSEAVFDAALGMGVAKIVVRPDATEDFQRWHAQLPWVQGDRVMYQVTEPPRLLDELGVRLTGQPYGTPRQTAIYFVFQGSDPLEVFVAGRDRALKLNPVERKPIYRRMLNEWWRAQQQWLKRDSSDYESYPPYLQTYLMGFHSRRMDMRLPFTPMTRMPADGEPRTTDLLVGSEALRQKMFWHVATGVAPSVAPDLEVPAAIQFAEPAYALNAPVEVEPIARQVPADCFYIRFGKYSNMLWFQHLMEEHAADIGRMVTLRGINADYGEKINSQLVIDELPFGELIGDQVIADVALIGRDLFLREGAAVGLILQQNAGIVAQGINKTRKAAAKDERVELTTVTIADREVSFLASSDHRIRSFYAERDGFHFITNCKVMMDDFLRLGEGVDRLSDTNAFQYARQEMPLDREDTLFAYFSPRFFAGLFSPHYRIEMQRRLRASCELDVVQLANLAWRNEVAHDFLGAKEFEASNQGEDWLQQMNSIRLLPPNFADRADQSQPTIDGDRWVDSRRGLRGYFLPIPDTPVTSATPGEVDDYEALAAFHAEKWQDFDPLIVAMQRARDKDSDELEQLTVDAELITLGQGKYGRFARLLGEPSSMELACDVPQLVSAQLSLKDRISLDGHAGSNGSANHISWGVLDQGASTESNRGGLLGALALWKSAPAFLTVTDSSLLSGRLLDRFRQFDENGYFRGVGDLWRRKHGEFTSLSYHRSVLEEVTPSMAWRESGLEPAHARLHVGALADSQLASWLRAAALDRGQRASLRNVRLMHAFISQLGVEGSAAREQAEQLVGAQLVCALGGEYRWGVPACDAGEGESVMSESIGVPCWCSTQWSSSPGEFLSEEFVCNDEQTQPALLRWFRGLDADLTQHPAKVEVHAKLLIRREPEEPKFEFSPLKFFTGEKAKVVSE